MSKINFSKTRGLFLDIDGVLATERTQPEIGLKYNQVKKIIKLLK